jgi:transglutaminase-like putative cysteine protease
MSIKVSIKHHTRYRFDRLVTVAPHIIRLRPAPHCRTPIAAYSLKVEPTKHFINWQQDPFGNYLARLVFPEKARSLAIDVELVADMTVINPFDFFLEESAQYYPFKYEARVAADLAPYLCVSEDGRLLRQWLDKVDRGRVATVDFLVAINHQLQQDIGYLIRMEPGVQSCEQTLQSKSGSCRDSAWVLVQIFRHLGLAARFVSGYLLQLTADVKALDGPSGPAQDFTDLHAWAEVYIPGAGWIGLDPTSGLFAAEGHIPLACTPEPASAAPVTGVTEKCEVSFEFYNKVTRIHEDPRVSSPLSTAQWRSVMQMGESVDRELQQQDVRLTMGGEPTFVSIDDMEGAEWNNVALGEKKRELAGKLLLRLREQFARGGLMHIGQGKW